MDSEGYKGYEEATRMDLYMRIISYLDLNLALPPDLGGSQAPGPQSSLLVALQSDVGRGQCCEERR